MAELVGVFGVPHTPLLWRLKSKPPADLRRVFAELDRFRSMLEDLRPDAIVMVASDHFHQFSFDNMPAFSIGKAEAIRGTYPNEERSFGLPQVDLRGDIELAEAIAGTDQLTEHIDFAFTNRPWLDHAYVVPLLELCTDLDVPVVPIHANTNAPPIPSVDRFIALGRHLRSAIGALPGDRRVVLVASGHLAFELGGPRQFQGVSPDPDFDTMAVGWIADGDLDGAREACSFERLRRAGNLGFQFLDFVALLAAAERPADSAHSVSCRFGSEPFFVWTSS
jgi:aromatic ring-opening dioxygenase catalytic subunit (LigB family)